MVFWGITTGMCDLVYEKVTQARQNFIHKNNALGLSKDLA